MKEHEGRSGPQRRAAWISMIEDALIEADDDEILVSSDMKELAQSARGVAQRAIEAGRDLRPALLPDAVRRRSRRPASRSAPRRAMVRELLVAHPRARDLVGKIKIEALSEEELETMIARFAELGILPGGED